MAGYRTQCRFLSSTDKSKEKVVEPEGEDKKGLVDKDRKSFNYATGEIQVLMCMALTLCQQMFARYHIYKISL